MKAASHGTAGLLVSSPCGKTYRKAGFHKEGVVRDAVPDGEQYADIIQMAMREDWRRRKEAVE